MPTKKRSERLTAEKVYNFYRDYIAEHGKSPNVREASDHFGHVKSNIHFFLGRLELAGCIKRHRGYRRSVELTNKPYSEHRAKGENRWRHELLDFLEGKSHVTVADLRRRFTSNSPT